MRIDKLDTQREVLLVAEVGNNHEGSYALAEELIGLAADAGAGAVKFQTFIPELLVHRGDAARMERLKKFQLSFEQFERLATHAKQAEILFFSTPFDLESAEFLNTICPVFKIASSDNTFFPLLQKVASFGKPIILSTGLATLAEIKTAVSLIQTEWATQGRMQGDLALLHCVSAYPVNPGDANLGAIRTLANNFSHAVGYSDHCLDIEIAAAAVFFGASIIEKHFTKDKQFSDFRDHQLSADPADLKRLVELLKYNTLVMGDGVKAPRPCEVDAKTLLRRSLIARQAIKAGESLSRHNIAFVRPGTGIRPGDETPLLGRRLKRDVSAFEFILPDDIAK